MTLVLALALATAQLSDFGTAIAYPEFEVHPVGAILLGEPLLALAVKVALVGYCSLVAVVAQRRHRYLGNAVLVIGIVAGLVGTWSNL